MASFVYRTDTGIIVADTSDLKATVQGEFTNAFGDDLVLDDNSPEGILIAGETIARSDVMDDAADMANQMNPNYAGGVFLDAHMRFINAHRQGASRSLCSCALTGEPGTPVSAGTRIRNSATGDLFALTGGVVLDSTGNGTGIYQATVAGPIPCASGTLTQIVDGVLGLETVTNPGNGTVGTAQASDNATRKLRNNILANQGTSTPAAIKAALYQVPGFLALGFSENYTDSPITDRGVTVLAHSIYACVLGGADADVAKALLSKKSGGCNWTGTVTTPVVDPVSGQTYNVSYDRPTQLGTKVEVTVRRPGLTDPTPAIQNAVVAYYAGLVAGYDGIEPGDSLSAFEVAGAIGASVQGLFITQVRTTLASSISWGFVDLDFNLNQQATITPSDVVVILL